MTLRSDRRNNVSNSQAPRELDILLVGSSGGHLAQLVSLRPWWEKHRRSWVTFDTQDAVSILDGEAVLWAFHPTTRNLPNLLRNLLLALTFFKKQRPDIVVSTGAAVAFPFFLIAKILGIVTCYIEVYDRIDSPTVTGRLCHPISDLFVVQWEEQLALYPKSALVGPLL